MMRLDMTRVCIITALALGAGGAARADLTLSATDNATIQPGGPRPGGNGKFFFNMEGSANNQFASFGVVDFATTGAAPISGLGLLRVQLVEANAAFTSPGSLNFYLSTSTATNIQPGTSPLVYNPALGQEGLGTQLDPKFLLGPGTFSSMGNSTTGGVDLYTFSLSSTAAAYINSQLGVGPLRIVITPTSSTVAATFAGFSNNQFLGPRLTLAVPVPEPGPLVQAGLGTALVVVVWAVRRHRAGRH